MARAGPPYICLERLLRFVLRVCLIFLQQTQTSHSFSLRSLSFLRAVSFLGFSSVETPSFRSIARQNEAHREDSQRQPF